MSEKIGIIAGGGQFPLLFAEAARKAGKEVIVVANEGEAWPEIGDVADRLYWVKLGQLGKIIKYFKKESVRQTVLLGTITKTRIFRDILPDLKGITLWNKINVKQDDAILRAVADALEKDGIKVVESTLYLEHLLFPEGVLTKKKPSGSQIKDIAFGWRIARSVGALDIGQCVVVRDGTVLAVEAIEGTDETIKRGGNLGKEKSVVIKVKKPTQDFRFDLPAIGIATIDSMTSVGCSLLVVETGQALLFDREAVVKKANDAGIVVIGVSENSDGSLVY